MLLGVPGTIDSGQQPGGHPQQTGCRGRNPTGPTLYSSDASDRDHFGDCFRDLADADAVEIAVEIAVDGPGAGAEEVEVAGEGTDAGTGAGQGAIAGTDEG